MKNKFFRLMIFSGTVMMCLLVILSGCTADTDVSKTSPANKSAGHQEQHSDTTPDGDNVNNEQERWDKMSDSEKIEEAKKNEDYTRLMSELAIANKADTLFLTVQEPGNTTACRVYSFEKKDGAWQQVFNTKGYVGRSGVGDPDSRVEGDGTTPAGVYSFGMLFGIKDNPGELQKFYKKVDEDDYWDGDSNSDTYNQYVKGSEMPSSWNRRASEHLIDYEPSYNYAAMVNFNVNPTIKGKGSAIFMHCTRPGASYSAGCVAIPEKRMLQSLKMIDDNAYIVIVRSIEDIAKYF